MFYFLGMTENDRLKEGNYLPSYCLCRNTISLQFNLIKMCNDNKKFSNYDSIKMLLVQNTIGHEDMIDYMKYITYMRGLFGYLMWYECNEKGEFNGHCIFVEQLTKGKKPDQSSNSYQRNFKRTVTELFTDDPFYIDNECSSFKQRFMQRFDELEYGSTRKQFKQALKDREYREKQKRRRKNG